MPRESAMNSSHLSGTWQEMRGLVRERWGRLTNDRLEVIAGRRDRLLGALHRRYGTARDLLTRRIRALERQMSRMGRRT
jgi:uncharacterized protein YjbJ (UPF0337 family)